MNKINELFNKKLKILNMGLESFHKDLESQKVESLHMNWRPVAGGDEKMRRLLDRLKSK
ncbi:fdrA domain protein [Acidaminobacter sp. JC074]|uniref:fdrA domain protein n=1 Tax=Acidaminobacter sp. JC074 TaxID=2530199 RepID=UPI001F118F10|nr:fdrA domain protein [Acidaminobacter sp. JC074]